MKFSEYLFLIKSDLYRYYGDISYSSFQRAMRNEPGYVFSFWMRTYAFITTKGFGRIFLCFVIRHIFTHFTYKFGISIRVSTDIGSGFYIGHFGGIVVSNEVIIGKNCNISQGVTIGQSNRGARKGVPVIGDNVYIGPGAKIFGRIRIGNNAAIGANCVVTKDVPDNAVVVGIPGRIISHEGSAGYVNRNDYERCLTKRK